MEDEIIRKYYISRENILRFVDFRGYEVSSNFHKTREEFEAEFNLHDDEATLENLKIEMSGLTFGEGDNKIFVKWYNDHKLGVGIRDATDEMEELNIKKAIIIVDEGITSSCKEIIKNLKISKKIIIDTLTLKESMIFVPDHVYVPKHRICNLREKKEIFKSYGVKNKDFLPHIKHDDIMVKYLGAIRGQLIEIIRVSDTNPQLYIKTYRIVM